MVMGAVFHTHERNGDVRPRLPEDFELELVHIRCFAVEEDEERKFGHAGRGLPAEDWVVAAVAGGVVLVFEVGFLDDLPALHHLRSAAEVDFGVPVVGEGGGGEGADGDAVAGEGDGVDAGLGGMCFLRAGDHVVEAAVDEVLDKGDVGGLVVVAGDAVGSEDAGVGVPGHGAGDVDEEHGFEVVCAVEDAVCEFVEGLCSGGVDGVGDLVGVGVRFDLLVGLEDVAGAFVGGYFLCIEVDLTGVAGVAPADYGVAVADDVEGAEGWMAGAVGHGAAVEEVVETLFAFVLVEEAFREGVGEVAGLDPGGGDGLHVASFKFLSELARVLSVEEVPVLLHSCRDPILHDQFVGWTTWGSPSLMHELVAFGQNEFLLLLRGLGFASEFGEPAS